jgi:hypothetical protein
MTETDGVDETLEQVTRAALTAAARAGEAVARRRQVAAQLGARGSSERAAHLQSRYEAEMQAARASYRRLDDPDWWASATPQDVARIYETATAWADLDEHAVRAQQRIEAEAEQHHGITLDPVGSSDTRGAEVAGYAAAAARADEPAWDSRERREETAKELGQLVMDERATEARMHSDVAQAHPARDAVRTKPERGTNARPGRTSGQRQRERARDR